MARFQLNRTYRLEAAHANAGGDERTARLHGHNYIVRVCLEDEANPRVGWFIDYAEMDAAVKPTLDRLDHHCLNDVIASPNACRAEVAAWIREQLVGVLPEIQSVQVEIASDCRFAPQTLAPDPAQDYPERWSFSVEVAHRLPEVYFAHKCGAVHGHSVRFEIAARDMERLRAELPDLFETLDHRYLNDIEGLENPTSENIALWVWERLSRAIDDLILIGVYETEAAWCVYRGPQAE